jgi:cytochrome c-type biogenesis protein CcsB
MASNGQALLYLSLGLYLASSGFYLISLSRPSLRKGAFFFLLTGLAAHFGATLVRYLQAGYTPITNLHESVSFFTLCLAAFFVYLRSFYRASILGVIVLPVLSALVLWVLTIPGSVGPLPPVLQSIWLPVHTISAFLGNAIFFMGFLVSIVYLGAERCIKNKKNDSVLPGLPSLETLDLINYRCMSFGFPLLTVGIMSGSIWAAYAWGSYWSWDPKETWSLITWIVYAILIHNRLAIGWRGRRTAYMMILGFISVLVTFLGVNLFIGGLHSYL